MDDDEDEYEEGSSEFGDEIDLADVPPELMEAFLNGANLPPHQPAVRVAEPLPAGGGVVLDVIKRDDLFKKPLLKGWEAMDFPSLFSSVEGKIPLCLPACLWKMCEGSPSAFLDKLKASGAFAKLTCGTVWKRGDWLYHCSTCQADPQCALCVDCFDEKLHEGHDYSIGRASGGVCDCGDENAWNPKGFCSRHRKRDPTEAEKVAFATPAFGAGFQMLAKTLTEALNKADVPVISNLVLFLSWIPQLFGDAVTPAVLKAFLSADTLVTICRTSGGLPALIQKLIEDMMFAFLGSLEFKMEFGKALATTLPLLLEQDNAPILQFNVQIFTNPLVAPVLMKDQKILMSLSKFVIGRLKSIRKLDDVTKKEMLEGEQTKRFNKVRRCVSDLRYFLTHKECSMYCIANEELWREGIVGICEALQGGVWLVRKTGEHVLFESQGYRNILSFEAMFWDSLGLLEDGLWTSNLGVDVFRRACEDIWNVLGPWIAKQRKEAARDKVDVYVDTKEPVTLSLSLHRLLSLVIRVACVGHGYPLAQVAPFLSVQDNALHVVCDIARLYHFLGTQEAGLWRRNGETAMVIAWFYTSPLCVENTIDREIVLARACIQASSNPGSMMAFIFASEFGAEENTKLSVRIGTFLRWVLTVCTDSSCCMKKPFSERAKRDIIHFLAGLGGSSTHSKLSTILSSRIAESQDFQTWLREVAEFAGSSFTLKRGLWQEVDPYFAHFGADLRQAAEEFCAAEFRKASKSPADAPYNAAPRPIDPSAFGAEGVIKVLQGELTWATSSLALSCLRDSEDAVKEFLSAALMSADLLSLCAKYGGEEFCKWVLRKADMLDVLKAAHGKTIPYLRLGIGRLLTALSAHAELAQLVSSGSSKPATAAVAETDEQRRARMREEAKERQRRIAEKMQAQRQQFAEANQVNLEKDEAEEAQLDFQCVLCHETNTSDADPICHLVLVQPYDVLREAFVSSNDEGESEVKKFKVKVTEMSSAAFTPEDKDSHQVLQDKCTRRMIAQVLDPSPAKISLRACTHCLHMSCYQQHFQQLYGKNKQEIKDMGICMEQGEYVCPLCQSVANAVVPSVKTPVVAEKDDESSMDAWVSDMSQWFKSPWSSSGALSLLQQRAGTLLWGYPPPIASSALLFDAAVSAVIADELTAEDGARDPMLRGMWDGCRMMVKAASEGDGLIGSRLWLQLLQNASGLDPFLTFCRLLLCIPANKRGAGAARNLFSLVGWLCLSKKENMKILRDRAMCFAELLHINVILPTDEEVTSARRFVQMVDAPCSSSFSAGKLMFRFCDLPQVLQEKVWFKNALDWVCPQCKKTADHPAVCLLCGTRACKMGTCCKVNGVGECSRHGESAHNGVGLWLDVKDSTILILRQGESGTIWKSPYLDAFGEEDAGLVRGRPLTLHVPILDELRRRFIAGTLIDLTINTGKRLLLSSWSVF